MAVSVKSHREIELMREAGKILGTVLNNLTKEIKPGMSTWHIDKMGEDMIRSFDCVPSFLGYGGYPASICVSINDEVVHGIPSKKRIVKEGDIVSLDAGVFITMFLSFTAFSNAFCMPAFSPESAGGCIILSTALRVKLHPLKEKQRQRHRRSIANNFFFIYLRPLFLLLGSS